MLKIINLEKSYSDKIILNNFNLHVKKGEVIGILGKNGAGKTTLFDCITTIAKIDKGDILINGVSIQTNPYETKNNIGICFQEAIFDRFFNVLETLIFTAQYRGISFKQGKIEAKNILEKVNLNDKEKRMNYNLSGGEKKRLQLAQAIISNPELILLDEPTAGLDLELKRCLFKIIDELKNREKTILLITHSFNEIIKVCTRVIFIKNGEISFDLNVDSSLNEEQLLELYERYCQ